MVEQVSSLKTGVKYKDTLAGRVPIDWEVGALSEIAEINPKRTLKKGAVYPFVEMAALDSDSHRVKFTRLRKYEGGGTKFRNGDTLFARITPCTENGKTAFIDFLEKKEFGHGSTEFIVLGPKDNVHPKFIYYSTKWDRVRNIAIAKMEGTSGRQRVPNRVFSEDIFVPLPPSTDQKKIAEILTTVDDAIEKTAQVIEKIKELKKGLMQRLLTRGIGHKKFKKTEIGEIPVDWEFIKLNDILELLTDFEANGSFADVKANVIVYDNKEYAWYVRATDLENKICLDSVKYVDEHSYHFLRKTKLYGGEVVITKRGEIGKVYQIPSLETPATLGPNLYLLKLNEKASNTYIYYFFKNYIGRKELLRINSSTTLGALYKDDVKKIPIPLPPLQEQKEIVDVLTSIDNEIEKEGNHKEQLELLKKGLMQVLLTGKIRVAV